MKTQRNNLLAGVAVLALVAGTGLASAQRTSRKITLAPRRNHRLRTQPMQQRWQLGGRRERPKALKAETRALPQKTEDRVGQSTSKPGMTPNASEKHAQDTNRGKDASKANAGDNSAARNEHRSNDTMKSAREHNKGSGAATAEKDGSSGASTTMSQSERKGLKGLQSNASGVNVKLSDEQRTKIRETVIDARGAPRVGHVNFDVTVGTVIPRGRVHAVRVPETLVQIEPSGAAFSISCSRMKSSSSIRAT